MKTARVFQITALLLVIVSVIQVGWWVYDQQDYSTQRLRAARAAYAREVAAAQGLIESGTPLTRVHELLPDVAVTDGHASASARVDAALVAERYRRINQYAWESGFFLLALALCIAVIWRALRAETQVLSEQDSFLALVSHQFKTPLASLQLSLETMAKRSLSAEQSRTLIDRMLADLTRMESMVSRILDSVRLERGRVDLKSEPVELAVAVGRVVTQFEERARQEHIELKADVPRGLAVLADPLAVDVIVRNLLENALAAVAAVSGGSVMFTARAMQGEVELAVRDSGVGFGADDSARLFKKFSRLHPGGGSSDYGTGLGLFIVRRLMQLTGGRVSAHSAGVGQGALFVLSWPAAPGLDA
ncbi:MAG TPA: HAMP domain-containing sensor histidine kinase [Steroidobacteraceae bacterium]|jgi:signal transduction histidine kinase|nr:HAMP domain-containing sensor histidine kinase [Steroidobacteraceae bacterium]